MSTLVVVVMVVLALFGCSTICTPDRCTAEFSAGVEYQGGDGNGAAGAAAGEGSSGSATGATGNSD